MITKRAFHTLVLVLVMFLLAIPEINSDIRTIENMLGICIIVFGCFLAIRNRHNVLKYYVYLAITYFNYSFILNRYWGNRIIMRALFNNFADEELYLKGINIMFLFMLVLLLCDVIFYDKNSNYNIDFLENNPQNDIISYSLLVLMICILPISSLFTFGAQFFEYSVIFIAIGTYYSGSRKLLTLLWGVVALFYFVYGNIKGMRVPVLPFVIAYFFLVFSKKINYKNLTLIFIIGIVVMTLSGLYGDGYAVSLNDTLEKLNESWFSLDTAQFAYLHSLIMVKVRSFTDNETILSLFIQFALSQIFGNNFRYAKLQNYTRKFFTHYDGGILPYYFYFYMGWLGVILIALFVGWIINKTTQISDNTSAYSRVLSIFILAMLPKWYLYEPAQLFRGVFLFTLVWYVCKWFSSLNRNRKPSQKEET